MTRVYFHATDGYELVIDRRGLRLGALDLAHCAALMLVQLRRHFGAWADLSDWLIVVQDEFGYHVETFAAAELPEIVEQDLAAA